MDLECSSKRADNGEQELQASSSTEDDPSEQARSSTAMEGPPSADILQQSQFDISSDSPARDGATRLVPNGSAQNGTGTEHSIFLEDDKNREHKRARRSKNWTRSETLKLIEMRTALDERFQRSGKKAMLWEEIAIALQKDKFSRDGQQCKDKWEKLTAAYKEVRDGMRESREHPFFNELNALLSWKSYKKEIDGGSEIGNPRSVKIELNSGPAFLSWNQGGVSYVINPPHLPTIGMTKVQFGHGFGSLDSKDVPQRYGVNSTDTSGTRRQACSSPKKQKRDEQICSLDCKAVQELLESVITRQQNFLKDWLDALDRKEQLREQRRHEREEKWREEERAQRFAFNSMMIRLTQRLLSERPPAMEVMPSGTMAAAMSNGVICPMSNGVICPKKRSKNWKKSEVTNLICVRQEMESKFLMSTRRAALWDELGEKLGSMGTHRDGKQCREKWDKLMAEYKDVADGRKDKDESAYFEQLSRFMAAGKDGALKTALEKTRDDSATVVKDDASATVAKDDASAAAPQPANGSGNMDHVV